MSCLLKLQPKPVIMLNSCSGGLPPLYGKLESAKGKFSKFEEKRNFNMILFFMSAIFCNFNFLSAGMDTPVEPQQVQPIVNVNLSEETPNQEGGNCAC